MHDSSAAKPREWDEYVNRVEAGLSQEEREILDAFRDHYAARSLEFQNKSNSVDTAYSLSQGITKPHARNLFLNGWTISTSDPRIGYLAFGLRPGC